MKLKDVDLTNLWKVPADQAFEWIKTGIWNKRKFRQYMEQVEERHERIGWRDGFFGDDY